MNKCRVIIKNADKVVGEVIIDAAIPHDAESARVALYAASMDENCRSVLNKAGFDADKAVLTLADDHATYSFASTECGQAFVEFIQL